MRDFKTKELTLFQTDNNFFIEICSCVFVHVWRDVHEVNVAIAGDVILIQTCCSSHIHHCLQTEERKYTHFYF